MKWPPKFEPRWAPSSNAHRSQTMDILDNPDLRWTHFEGSRHFDYPIDYWGAILGVRDEGRQLDLVYRWEPNSYCHFHRHLAPTTSVVLAGELHVTDFDSTGHEVGTRIRRAGDYSHTATPDVHMECGGPDGAVVLFNIFAPDGDLTHVLSRELEILNTTNAAEVVKAWERRNQG